MFYLTDEKSIPFVPLHRIPSDYDVNSNGELPSGEICTDHQHI